MANFYLEVSGVKHVVTNKYVSFREIRNISSNLRLKGEFNKRKKVLSAATEQNQ